jgi:hypothetical protein
MQATSGQTLAPAGGRTVQTNGSMPDSDQAEALDWMMPQAQAQDGVQAQAQAQEGAPTLWPFGSGQAPTIATATVTTTITTMPALAQEGAMGPMMTQAHEFPQAQAQERAPTSCPPESEHALLDILLNSTEVQNVLFGPATYLKNVQPGQDGPAAGGLHDRGDSDSGSVTDAGSDAISGNAGGAFEPLAVAHELPVVMAMPMPMPMPIHPANVPAAAAAAAAAVVSGESLDTIRDRVTSIYSRGCPEPKQFYKGQDTGGCGSLEPNAHYSPLCTPLTEAHTTFPFWDYAEDWQYNTASKQKVADSNVDEDQVVITVEQPRFKSSHSIAGGYSTKQPFAVKGDPLNGGAYFLSNRKEGAAWQTTLVQVTNCDYEGLQAALVDMRESSGAIPGDDIPPWARLVYLTDAGSGDHFSITPLSYTVGEKNGLFKNDISSKIAPCTVSHPEAPFNAIDTATGKPIIVHPSEERYHKTSRLIKGIDGEGEVLTHIGSDGTLAQALLTRDQTTSSGGLSRAVVHWAMHTDLQSAACTGNVAKKGRFFRLYTTPANPRLRHLSKLSAHSPPFLISTLPGRTSSKRKALPPGMGDLPPRGVARNA